MPYPAGGRSEDLTHAHHRARGDGAREAPRRARPSSPQLDDHPAVRRLQHRHREHLIGRPERDLAAVEAQDAVPPASLLDVVRGDQNRPSFPCESIDQLATGRVALRVVELRERLVQEQDARILHQGPRDEHALTLPAGQLAEAPRGKVREPDRGQRLACRRPLPATRMAPPAPEGDGPHQSHVERAHRVVQSRPLGLWNGRAARRDGHLARHGLEFPQQRTKQRRLSAAVRA